MVEPILIRQKRLLNLLYLIGALVFTFISFYFTFVDLSFLPDRQKTKIIFLKPILFIGILFFGLCSYHYIRRMFQLKIILQVDETGVTDASSATAIGHIPWEDIVDIRLTHLLDQKFISIFLKNEDDYLSQMNFLQRNAYKANLKMGFPLVNIILNTSGKNPKLVLNEIENKFGHYYKEKNNS